MIYRSITCERGGNNVEARDRIVLALDVDTRDQALSLVKELACHVGVFKVGMQLFNSTGPSIVREINELGGRVFVDLKFHDIPNTVSAAGRVMTRLGCYMFNVHAAGGSEMMKALVQDVKTEARKVGVPEPLTLAVTVLTSINQAQLENEMFVKDMEVGELVVKWALMAKESGIVRGGLFTSGNPPRFARPAVLTLKRRNPGNPAGLVEANDQKRT